MNEKIILAMAFIGSMIGLIALFLFVENLDYGEKTIEKINAERIRDMVKIKGEVVSVNDIGNLTFISLMQPSYMDIVVFDHVDLFSGEKVEIIGSTEEYEGKMEVIAHRIRVIR
jgi:DNA/RNA endonuclease YhcR with UshA esterase domain